MIAVCDTSPLNYLVWIGCEQVLPALFERVHAPGAVLRELDDPATPSAVRAWAQRPPPWLLVTDPDVIVPIEGLGPGETSTIALARHLLADRLVMDDRDGRAAAAERSLRVVGTLGVLTAAAERGLIDLEHAFRGLRATSFHVREDLLRSLLARFGTGVRRTDPRPPHTGPATG